jgi:hypothetical protein
LSRYPSLFVIARNSCFTYKGRTVDVMQVGRELGVRYVLEGKAGNRISVTAQLSRRPGQELRQPPAPALLLHLPSVAVVLRYPRGRCHPASGTFAGEPDIVGWATCRIPGRAGYLCRRLTLVARDRFHPNANDLEIVGGVHANFPPVSLI